MSGGQVTGAVKLEDFTAASGKDIELVGLVVAHKLMQWRSQPQFLNYVSQFLASAVEGMPSQEIGKVLKEVQKIVAVRNAGQPKENEEKAAPKKRKVRGTLAMERDEISAALDAMDIDDDMDEDGVPVTRVAKKKASPVAGGAPAQTRSLQDYLGGGVAKGKGGAGGGKKGAGGDDWLTADKATIEATKALAAKPAVRGE